MHSSLAVANYFIQAALAQGLANRDFPASKVHGLVYLAHGWLLGSAGANLIKAPVMADRDGVFVPELREAGCAGTKNVTALVSIVEMDTKRGIMVEHTPQMMAKHPSVAALAWCWKTYGPLSSFAVGQHVKEAGSPWDKVWNDEKRRGDEPRLVPAPLIKTWFKSLTSRREVQSHTSKLSKTQKLELHQTMGKSQLKLRSS